MIGSATFLTSLAKFDPNFETNCAEVVFLGRSNVGKSSFINTLCKQRKLVKSSSTPGKMRLINFFEIKCKKNEEEFKIHSIGLPGFGYTKVSENLREIWNKNLDEFLKLHTSIKLFLHLIDAGHTNLGIDLSVDACLKSLLRGNQQILKIFTKADKLNQSQRARLRNHFENSLLISNLNKSGLALLESIILEETLGL